MNASDAAASRPRILRTLGLSLGLAAAMLINSGDRAFTASSNNMGIDPLQILDTGVKSNILFLVSQSETLAGTTLGSSDVVGGDDPASRFYQVKQAIRDVISQNYGKANFGLAAFQPSRNEHVMEGTKGLVYVTQDPTGDLFRNNFTAAAATAGSVTVTLGGNGTPATSNSTTITGPSWTPAPNSLIVAVVTANGAVEPTGVTGHGAGAYTKVTAASKVVGNTAMSVWVAKAGSTPTSAAAVATWASTRSSRYIAEYQVVGADLTGTALAAIVQTVTANNSSAGTTVSATLASGTSTSAVMGFVMNNNAATVGSPGWTEGSDVTYGTGVNKVGVEVQYRNTFSTSLSGTLSTSSLWAAAAIEIKVAPPLSVIDTCTGSGGACSAAESAALFALLTSNDGGTTAAYPPGCTAQTQNQVEVGGAVNAPITHNFGDVSSDSSYNSGIHCRYYVRSKLLLNGKKYTVNRGAAPASAITSSANITCPAPPPGLLGDDTAAFNDGSKKRPCFQIQDVTPTATNKITTYWLTGAQFIYQMNTNPGTTPYQCNETGIRVGVDDCDTTNSPSQIAEYMRLELQYNPTTGLPTPSSGSLELTPLTALSGLRPGNTLSPIYDQVGLRLGTGTPLTKAMIWAKNYFNTTIFTDTDKRPDAAIGKQRQYVILIADADDTCNTLTEAQDAAYALWSNSNSLSCDSSCLASRGLTAAQWAAANRIELVMVPFGGGTQSSVDLISRAGSGVNPSTGICEDGAPCRSATIARNLTEFKNLLSDVIYSGSETGEYSDQQSVTETVFEFASLATPSKDPLDPNERYAVSVPVLMQSTFNLPGYLGHLKAFRRSNSGTVDDVTDDVSVEEWDAGQKLYDRVSDATTGMGTGVYAFSTLYGNATSTTVKTSTAKIKRRIYSTIGNGVNAGFTVSNLLAANVASLNPTGGSNPTRIAIWPPVPTTTSTLTSVAPTATGTNAAPIKGMLDAAMGFDSWTTVAQVQAAVPGVCKSYVAGDLHADCSDATKSLARAKREARETILAWLAGARLKTTNGIPVRCTATNGTNSCGSNSLAGELSYVVRPWIMSESTLAAPGVVTPPLLAGPVAAAGAVGVEEYKAYRDGLRNASTGVPVNGIANGLGLRNPDRVDASFAQDVIDAAAEDVNLKPSMSVVYHATNQGLHAFRAGPCPTPPAGSGISALTIPCAGETGGEELWAFVPYDVLSKLPALTRSQSRNNKQYLLASPVRFADIFVPGTGTFGGQAFTGVWRTILYFGRGAGGKYYTALDVTTPGPFTKHSLTTSEPIVVWSRGNPDTTRGLACNVGTHNNTATSNDCPLYSKMGESWSVPAVGFVTAASYTTSRTGSNGTNFALFVGSGFSDVSTEGKTFFVLDALNGDIIRSFDIANGSVPAQSPTLTNFLVASPVGYTEDNDGNSPAGYNFIGNPIATKTKTVYFGDIHSRLWRYDATTPATAPVAFFTADTADAGNQPFATAVSVLQNKQADDQPADLYVFAESGFDRRVAIDTDKPFKAYAFKDVSGTREDVFEYDFPASYRGSVQPASGFAGTAAPLTPIVFYAGIKFNQSCVSTFDSVLIALKATVSSPGVPEAAFDLKATGDDAFLEMTGKRINAIRVSGEGSLVIDQGLNAQDVPPPPGVAVPSVAIPGSSSIVRMGLTPGTQDYKDLVATTQPYRVGSSVCRTQ